MSTIDKQQTTSTTVWNLPQTHLSFVNISDLLFNYSHKLFVEVLGITPFCTAYYRRHGEGFTVRPTINRNKFSS